MSMVKELLFKVTEKDLKDGSKTFIVTDSEGYMCGFYATLQDAEKAMPAIRRNILKGSVSSLLLEEQNRKKFKQLYRKK